MPHAPSIFRKALHDQLWQVAGFGLALAAIGGLDVLTWPSIRDAAQNLQIPSSVQALLGSRLSITTAAGNLSARFFGWTPVLLIVYAVIQGTGAIAGEDGAGTLELLLAQPVSRRRVVLEKAAATFVGAIGMLVICFAGFATTVPLVAIDLSLADVAVAVANMLPMTLLFFGLALWLGAWAPARAPATAAAIACVTVTYVANTLAEGVGALRGLQYVTPFHYYGAGLTLVDGIAWGHVALLLGFAAMFLVLALHACERRDIAASGGDIDLLGALSHRPGGGRAEAAGATRA